MEKKKRGYHTIGSTNKIPKSDITSSYPTRDAKSCEVQMSSHAKVDKMDKLQDDK